MTSTTLLLLLLAHWIFGAISQGLLPTGIILQLDFDPTGPNCAAWMPFINSVHNHTNIPFFITINPDSGPGGKLGSQPDEDYQNCVPKLRAPNVKLLGYVDTLLGTKSLNNTSLDISTYAQWNAPYRPDGIFLDEALTSSSSLPLYQNYTALVRKSFSSGPIVLDPGDYPEDSGYFEIADLIIVYEGSYDSFQSVTLAINSQAPASKQAVIVTSTPSQLPPQFLQDVAATHKLGATYASNLSEDGAFVQIPPYWTNFVANLSDIQTKAASSSSNASTTSGSTITTQTISTSNSPQSSTLIPQPSGNSHNHAGAIAGGVVGGFFFFGLVGFAVSLLRRSYKSSRSHSRDGNSLPFGPPSTASQIQSRDMSSIHKDPMPPPIPSTSSAPLALPTISTDNFSTIASPIFSGSPLISPIEGGSRHSEDPYLSSDLEPPIPGSVIRHQDSGIRLHSQVLGVREFPPLYSEE